MFVSDTAIDSNILKNGPVDSTSRAHQRPMSKRVKRPGNIRFVVDEIHTITPEEYTTGVELIIPQVGIYPFSADLTVIKKW